jgi:MYXO-CTERM domain-containing protein
MRAALHAVTCSLLLLSTAAFAGGAHMMPLRSNTNGSASTNAAPAGAHLEYYGGPVMANVHVIPVFWGSGVSSAITTTSGGIADFYTAITDSRHYDMLKEYSTNIVAYGGQQGSSQQLGHGTAQAGTPISPSNTKTSITDAEIQTELQAQISAGHLPAASANNIYMINFPSNITISLPDGNGGTATSCTQFCAYHSTIAGSPTIKYGVIPDVTAGSCALGCGPVGGGFNNTTSVASHELVEATTDAEVGLATNNAPPLGWYDPQGTNGEIGDICNGTQGTINSHGRTWTIQQEWSNTQNACVSEPANNDFYLSIGPGNQNLAAGQSTTYTISSGITSGSVGSVSLSASLPAGLSASFSSTSLSAGGTATVTISATTSATNGDNVLTIQGSGAGVTRYAKGHATVSGGSAGGGGGGGGNCPPGTTDIGGICVPTGCNTQGGGGGAAGGLALLVAGVALWMRKRQ